MTEDPLETDWPRRCCECDERNVVKSDEPRTFTYGTGDDKADITVTVPLYTCKDCGCKFYDHEATEIEHNAVCKHLGMLNPAEIKQLRTSNSLSILEFARTLSVSSLEVEKWERGALIQKKEQDQLMRLIKSTDIFGRLFKRIIDLEINQGKGVCMRCADITEQLLCGKCICHVYKTEKAES